MILYKYLGLKSAKKMIESCTLGFTQPPGLNDPTETTASRYQEEDECFWWGIPRQMSIAANYGVLSMTRNAMNATMWAHYAEKHTGLVIGIDTHLAGLDDEESCVLPARYGSVIYTSSKPVFQYMRSNDELLCNGQINSYSSSFMEALQRCFLYKSSDWYYEEEVRAVKSIQMMLARGATVLQREGDGKPAENSDTYLVNVPRDAIKRVYLGLRSAEEYEDKNKLCSEITQSLPNVELFDCRFERHTWRLVERPLGDWAKTLSDDFRP